jgi:hypothetical protein
MCGQPTSQDAKPLVQPRVHPPFYITNVGGEPRVWHPEMWALRYARIVWDHDPTLCQHSAER